MGLSDHKSVHLSVRFLIVRQNTQSRKFYLYSVGDFDFKNNELQQKN